jgi:hypothetical protein
VNVQPSELDGPSARHLLRGRDGIDPRYADPLGVAALASLACCCARRGTGGRLWECGGFLRAFRDVTGTTPAAYRRLASPEWRSDVPWAISGGIVATDDCRGDYEALSARGVEFQQEPMDRGYGIDAAFRDPTGNLWRITQRG